MEIRTDFKELLELFNKHEVEYFIANKKATGRTKDAADIEALGGAIICPDRSSGPLFGPIIPDG